MNKHLSGIAKFATRFIGAGALALVLVQAEIRAQAGLTLLDDMLGSVRAHTADKKKAPPH